MFGDAEGEFQIFKLGRARRSFGDDLQIQIIDESVVAALYQKAAVHRAERQFLTPRIGQTAGEEQAQIEFRADDLPRLFARIGGDDHLGKNLDDLPRGFSVERAIQCDDAAEGGDCIAAQRQPVGVRETSPTAPRRTDWRA